MIKAVIFDIDGTLLDSVDLHAESWVKSLATSAWTPNLQMCVDTLVKALTG